MSQLLTRLDRDFQSATGIIERAEILARKGSYLARVGDFSAAREIIAQLRQQFGDGRSGHVTAWIMLTEGLLHLFEDLSPQALDRITRSQVLGLAMKDSSVIAVASAWKAHIEFETSNFDAMIKSLEIAFSHANENDHDAHVRLAIVLSESFQFCGDTHSAQFWFLRGRDHALKDGDLASIEALLYNRAAFGLARLRVERCTAGEIAQDRLSMARLEIASAKNLQNLSGVAALTNFIHLSEARLLVFEEKYAEAIDALRAVRNAKPFADYNFNQTFVDLELAFCLQRLGRTEESKLIYDSLSWAEFADLDLDEQLIAAWMRWLICSTDESLGSKIEARRRLDSLFASYEEMRTRLLDNLHPFQRMVVQSLSGGSSV